MSTNDPDPKQTLQRSIISPDICSKPSGNSETGKGVRHRSGPTRSTIMTQMNSVVHFEMPYDDRERMANFYRDAFGWQKRMLGEEMGNYVIATTTETDESGPKRPGAINGGFFARKPDWPAQHPSLVIAVDNI